MAPLAALAAAAPCPAGARLRLQPRGAPARRSLPPAAVVVGLLPQSCAVDCAPRRARPSLKRDAQPRPWAVHAVTRDEAPAAVAPAGPAAWKAPALRALGAVAVAVAVAGLLNPPSALAASGGAVGLLKGMVDFILHLDTHLAAIIAEYGKLTYAILFGIVFCETGLVVTPFLPGDSLLFAAGAFAALGSLEMAPLLGVLLTAAVLGDGVNYFIGKWLGTRAVESKLIDASFIARTEKFYEKYGSKTIILARFVPIVRTFAPFVAGIGSMDYAQFATYNVVGALVWVLSFTFAGFFFGGIPAVQHNFTLVVLGIVAVSVIPAVYEVIAARREAAAEKEAEGGSSSA